MKRGILLKLSVLTFIVVSAQMPELELVTPSSSDVFTATGIEKARLNYLAGNLKIAEALLYAELEKGNFESQDFLLFANTLNADHKPALANEFYKEYLNQARLNTTSESKMFKQFLEKPKSSYAATNSASAVSIENPVKYKDKIYSANMDRLFQYDFDCDGSIGNETRVLQGLTDMPFGSVTFFDDGEKAVASLINKVTNKSGLWLFCKKKGVWKKPKKLFEESDANYAFPFVDESTNTLYFSSDKEGGFGGYDIYLSIFDGKEFTSNLNLGKDVNTSLHEINPTKTNQWLYFSSNGHISYGGYDLYKYSNIDDFNSLLVNCFEFNTKKDELSIIPSGTGKFYVHRQNDNVTITTLYSKGKTNVTRDGVVMDTEGNAVQGAYVCLVSETGDAGNFAITGADGSYSIPVPNGSVSKSGVVLANNYEMAKFNGNKQKVVLSKIKPKEIIKEVVNQAPNSVKNPPKEAVVIAEGDVGGATLHSSASSADRGFYYVIIGSTNDYPSAFSFWQKWSEKFTNLEILEYNGGLFRIGFYGGKTESEANTNFQRAKKIKSDIWILRPKA